jgi:hypothetical protein
LVPFTRAAFYGSTPPWPAALIEPSHSELARWRELWSHPLAAIWIQTEKEHLVAAVVRLEHRCSQARSSPRALTELQRLRHELGLDTPSL